MSRVNSQDCGRVRGAKYQYGIHVRRAPVAQPSQVPYPPGHAATARAGR